MSIASLSNPILKPLPIGNSSKISAATIFSTEFLYPHLSISSRSIKLHLSCSSSFLLSSLSLNKSTLSSSLVPLVAQTSDWAQQNGESTFLEEPHEFETLGGSSDWGPAGEEVTEDRSAEEPNEPFQEPPEEAKLFVGNLPYEIDAETLAGIFEQAGIVISSDVIYNRDTQQSRGFGFVKMSTVEEAEKAVEMFHHYDLDGRPLTVNKAAPRGTQPVRAPRISNPAFRIYVGNLPWNVDIAYLEQVFSEHGKVVDARVVYERETNRSRGFGFVTMSNETEVNDAIAALNGQSLDGREIRVSKAEERSRRGFV